MELTKYELFMLGMYTCPVPPVNTMLWKSQDWIDWIDNKGEWIVQEP